MDKPWHEEHRLHLTTGQRLADGTAHLIGSWPFIIWQSVAVSIWVVLNAIAWSYRWDPYPFILLNLAFSVQAAYAAPIIMMAQNRQSDRDRVQADQDFQVNRESKADIETAKNEIEALQKTIARIESDKLDTIAVQLTELIDLLKPKLPGEVPV
jgi:uncharacterized membrane protein